MRHPFPPQSCRTFGTVTRFLNARFLSLSSGALGVLVLAQTAAAQVCFQADPPTNVGLSALNLLSADLDGDGDTDLVATDTLVQVVSVLLNHGDGTFAPYAQYDAGLHAWAMTGADLDGDGDTDLAVVRYSPAGIVSVLLNQGNGIFGTYVHYGVGARPTGITSADLDGDGDIDVATSNENSNTVSVLLNQGQGSFAPHVQYAAGIIPYGVTSADLDGDGDVDLAVGNLIGGTVSVLSNQGNGTFASPAPHSIGGVTSAAYYVANADLNGDGREDVVALDDSNDYVAVLVNQGGGGFAPYVTYPVGNSPQRVVGTDLDEDGDLDLAVMIAGPNSLSLLLNRGDGTFAPYQEIAAGTVILPVTHADFDGDGDSDLAVDNVGAQTITVHRNCFGPGIGFCFGDGSLRTSCPCVPPNTVPNPSAAPGHGCANSLNPNGALLTASGSTTPAPGTVAFDVLVASNYVGFGLMVKGNANATAGIAAADGIRCVDGQLVRFGSHFAGTNGAPQGHWTYPNSVQTNPVSVQTAQQPGQTAYYQLFYRAAAPNFCNAATTNWSNGYRLTWP